MWEYKELHSRLKEFDVSTLANLDIFGDWLEDQEQFEWAYLLRYFRGRSREVTVGFVGFVSDPSLEIAWSIHRLQVWVKEDKLEEAVKCGMQSKFLKNL